MKRSILFFLLLFIFVFISCANNKEETAKANSSDKQLFSLLDPRETGVDFNNKILQTDEEYIINFNYIFNGGGVAIADFD